MDRGEIFISANAVTIYVN